MLMFVAATQRWRLQPFDVTDAFLQGEELPSQRVLYMRLPRRLSEDCQGMREVLQCTDLVLTCASHDHRAWIPRVALGAVRVQHVGLRLPR